MIADLPLHVSLLFILTAICTVWLLLRAIPRSQRETVPARLLLFLIPFWLILQAILGSSDFYRVFNVLPPRIFLFAVLPVLTLSAAYFLFFKEFIDLLSLRWLTLIHVVRIPVELTLYSLFEAHYVPREMTFEGWNFDIFSGLTAILVYFLAFRGRGVSRGLLIVWNMLTLGLLVNIVVIAILALPTPSQQIGFDQPNVAVTYFPFIWLPAVVVPIVFFSHLSALWKLFRQKLA